MVPQQSGNPAGVPNLIRRSVRSDPILSPPAPTGGSLASAVNSAPVDPANPKRGEITLARWNKHYLIPKANTSDQKSDPVGTFTAPDWVFVTSDVTNQTAGRKVIFSPDQSVIGRYAYAIYDEGGLVDMNVAGYPSPTPTPPAYVGRKGVLAFADLTALPTALTQLQINSVVGWRNYATAQPTPAAFPSFTFNTTSAANYYNYVTTSTNGFITVNSASVGTGISTRTDQAFVTRQQLINFQSLAGFNVNVLQYLGTFSRETNSPSFSPATPTTTNPNFLLAQVRTIFTRFDGTTANVGDPLMKTRFPLSRLAWITYKGPSQPLVGHDLDSTITTPATSDPIITNLVTNFGVSVAELEAGTAANIKACFGLTFPTGGTAGSPWTYTNHKTSTDTAQANTILTLGQVADPTIVTTPREPDFFEVLQAAILNGSLGQNTGGGVTGGNVFPDIHMSSTTHHILTIGACIIDQASPESIPTRIQFTGGNGNTWTAYGVKNLPYITQIYPIAGTSPNDSTKWATYLLFQLWNPHQNAGASTPSVRLRVDGAIGIFTGGNSQTWVSGTTPQIIAAGQSVILNSAFSFSAPTPLTNVNTTNAAAAPGPPAGGAFAFLPAFP
jgi:hypothetical protein